MAGKKNNRNLAILRRRLQRQLAASSHLKEEEKEEIVDYFIPCPNRIEIDDAFLAGCGDAIPLVTGEPGCDDFRIRFRPKNSRDGGNEASVELLRDARLSWDKHSTKMPTHAARLLAGIEVLRRMGTPDAASPLLFPGDGTLPDVVRFFVALDKTSLTGPLGREMHAGRKPPRLSIFNTVVGYYVDQLLYWALVGIENDVVYSKTGEFQWAIRGLIEAGGKDAVAPFFKPLDDDNFMSSLSYFGNRKLSRIMAESGAFNNTGVTSVEQMEQFTDWFASYYHGRIEELDWLINLLHLKNPYKDRNAETTKMLGSIRVFLDQYESDAQLSEVIHCRLEMDDLLNSWIYNSHGGNIQKAKATLGLIAAESDADVFEAIEDLEERMKPRGKILQIVLVEEDNSDSRVAITCSSRYQLVNILRLYAYRREVSIMSLRFSHADKPLFLSSARRRTVKELGMQDQDEIIVCAASNPDPDKENNVDNFTQKQVRKIEKANNKKSSRRKIPIIHEEPKDYRAQHSIILTKLHEELRPHLKDIRTKLNALDLLRQSPKSKNVSKKSMDEETNDQMPPGSGLGGKAGKPHFVVQVGDVHNLYKTTKSSADASPQCQGRIPTLDLHGCTRDEAIIKLNESLKVWVDAAMKGYHPFVITVVIVCGCGSQVLSETVQEWVKSTSQVRNAPKNILV